MSVSLERGCKNKKISFFKKCTTKTSILGSLFGVFWRSLASLGPLWDQLLRMCLHSCVPTPFLVKFGAPAPPQNGSRRKGRRPSGGEGKQTFHRKSEQTVWEGCRLCKNASVHALGCCKETLQKLYRNFTGLPDTPAWAYIEDVHRGGFPWLAPHAADL